MQKVWNVTDWPGKNLGNRNMMILGKVTPPGRALHVEEDLLARAHKVNALIKEGLLYVGPRPPAEYLKAKKPPRAVVDARKVEASGAMVGEKVAVATAHGVLPAEAIAEDASAKIKEDVEPEEVVEAAPEPDEWDEDSTRVDRPGRE